MELTFMPKPKGPSPCFLQKFKGKMSRVNRYGGFQRIADGCPRRYQSIDLATSKQNLIHRNRTRKSYSSNGNSGVNSKVQARKLLTQSCQPRIKATEITARRHKRVPSSNQNKQNIDDSNVSQIEVFLPRLSNKQVAYPKCSNRIKSTYLQKKERKQPQTKTIRSRIIFAPLQTIQHNH